MKMKAEVGASHKEMRTSYPLWAVEENSVISMIRSLSHLIGAKRVIMPLIRLLNNAAMVG
jgi:hypothetical protein